MSKLIFIYENLNEQDKKTIDFEIEKSLKKMILSKGSFSFCKSELESIVNELALRNKVIENLIGGNSISYFNLKATVIWRRAFKIAHYIECNKPSLTRLKRLIELCATLEIEPYTEMLFDKELVEKHIELYECYIREIGEKKFRTIVDFDDILNYNNSSNITSFVRKMNKLYLNPYRESQKSI